MNVVLDHRYAKSELNRSQVSPALSVMAGLVVFTEATTIKVQKNEESVHKICEYQKKVVPLRRQR